jgi:hypothetical protein
MKDLYTWIALAIADPMGGLVIALILAIGGYLGYRWVTRGDKALSAEQPASGAQHGGVTR